MKLFIIKSADFWFKTQQILNLLISNDNLQKNDDPVDFIIFFNKNTDF